jgi:hypothetical protein
MEYRLYTTVDITRTGQFRNEPGKDFERKQEQNFQTVLQTIGIRANISFGKSPILTEVNGNFVGFNTTRNINVWQFDFNTEQDHVFEQDTDPVGFLLEAFDAVPYISGLNESMEQNYAVFVTEGVSKNIVFQIKQ